jgi:hypothetical protein
MQVDILSPSITYLNWSVLLIIINKGHIEFRDILAEKRLCAWKISCLSDYFFKLFFHRTPNRKVCRTNLYLRSKPIYIFQQRSCYYNFLGICLQLHDYCLKPISQHFQSSNQVRIHTRCRILKRAKISFVPMIIIIIY